MAYAKRSEGIARARTNNNNRNGANVKTSAKTNGTSATTKSKVANASPQEEALALLKELRNLIFKEYGVKLQLRDSRVSTKIGHAAREKLGLDIAAQVKKKGGNKKFDWQKWNTKLFTKLFGQQPFEAIANLCSTLETDGREIPAGTNFTSPTGPHKRNC